MGEGRIGGWMGVATVVQALQNVRWQPLPVYSGGGGEGRGGSMRERLGREGVMKGRVRRRVKTEKEGIKEGRERKKEE